MDSYFVQKRQLKSFNDGIVSCKFDVYYESCGLLWCFYQLFGLSFWHHSHWCMSNWCNATFLQICCEEQTNSSTACMGWGWINIQQMFIFGRTILLNVDKIVYFAILNMHDYMVSCVLCFFYSLLLSEQTCNPPVKKCWFDSHYCTPYGKAFLHCGMNCLLTLKPSLGF